MFFIFIFDFLKLLFHQHPAVKRWGPPQERRAIEELKKYYYNYLISINVMQNDAFSKVCGEEKDKKIRNLLIDWEPQAVRN